MLSIEDARREISGHLVEHIRDKTHPQARCCLAVADAYALATLEETIAHEALRDCGHAEGGAECFAWLRARIKNLGK